MRICLLTTAIASVLTTAATGYAERRPNVIVIFTDDHGWSDLGVQNITDDLKTPQIDAMAAEGRRMTNGYVTAPQCVPSRAGLLIGKSQNRFGTESNNHSLKGQFKICSLEMILLCA